MKSKILIAFLVFLGIRATVGQTPEADLARSDREKAEFFAHASSKGWGSITRWLIEYEATPLTKGYLPVHRIMAASAPADLYHLGSHFPNYPWQEDPYAQEVFISGEIGCHRWPFRRAYSEVKIEKTNDIPEGIANEFFWYVVPKSPVTERKMPHPGPGVCPLIGDAFESKEYRMQTRDESVSGEECIILDNKGVDRVWVAIAKDLCVMRRELRSPDTGRLLERISTQNLLEVAPGIWLPAEVRREIFADPGAPEKVTGDITFRVLRCLLNNEVSDSTFIPKHPPGSLRYDAGGGYSQVSPGGYDLLLRTAEFAVKYGGMPSRSIKDRHPWLWFGGGAIGGLCMTFFLFSARRPRC